MSADALRVLITNVTLGSHTGSETFVADLAVGLQKAGDRPMVWSPILGPIAQQLRESGVPVVSDLHSLPAAPDVIHGHHNVTTLAAVLRFPESPAIFVCHDRNSWFDAPPPHPRIVRWVAVDQNCRERLVQANLPEDRIAVLYNWVDPERFTPRRPLPAQPRRALVFSNYTGADAVDVLHRACAARGITLEVLGSGAGNTTSEPERVLPEFDVVFAKARSALEAMASGTAVVLFGPTGLGPLVSSGDLERLRPWNFGMRVITTPVTVENVAAQLARYSAADAPRVSAWIREHAALRPAVESWRSLYREVVAAGAGHGEMESAERVVLSEFLEGMSAHAWGMVEALAAVDRPPRIERRGPIPGH